MNGFSSQIWSNLSAWNWNSDTFWKIPNNFPILGFGEEILCKSYFAKFFNFGVFLAGFGKILPFISKFEFQKPKFSQFWIFKKINIFEPTNENSEFVRWTLYWPNISKYALEREDFYRVRESNTWGFWRSGRALNEWFCSSNYVSLFARFLLVY